MVGDESFAGFQARPMARATLQHRRRSPALVAGGEREDQAGTAGAASPVALECRPGVTAQTSQCVCVMSRAGSSERMRFDVDMIERLTRPQPPAHFGVDRAAGGVNVERGAGACGELAHPRRVIALVRSPDQRVRRAEPADDLGAAGEEGNNLHLTAALEEELLHVKVRDR